MSYIRRFVCITGAVAVAIGTLSTVTAPPASAATQSQSAMGTAIGQMLNGRVEGYAWAIEKNRVLTTGSNGDARRPVDGFVDFTPTTRMEIMSGTKNIMAAAILQLLEKNPTVSVDTSIVNYLPESWQRASGWEKVTFRMLLSHTSGLNQQRAALGSPNAWNTLWSGVQFAVSNPITAPSPRLYQNMNYAMLRVLLPRLWKLVEPENGQPALNSTNSGQITLAYQNKYLLQPSGISAVSCSSGGTTAFAYDGPNTNSSGINPALSGALAELCGGDRGLIMSATDLVRWERSLRFGSVVSSGVRNLMDNVAHHSSGVLGWWDTSNNRQNPGQFTHPGDGVVGQRGWHTCHGKFPNNVHAAVMINSQRLNGSTSMCAVLRNAYNASVTP